MRLFLLWLAVLCLLAPVFGQVPTTFEADLTGTLGSKLQVRMHLVKQEGEILTGFYYYPKSTVAYVPANLSLRGILEKDGSVQLYETDDQGNTTGMFVVKLTGNGKRIPFLLIGTWESPGGKRKLSVTLTASVVLSVGPSVTDDVLTKTSKTNQPFTLSARWPVFVGGKGDRGLALCNQALEAVQKANVQKFLKFAKEAAKPESDAPAWELESFYEIGQVTDKVVSVRFFTYSFEGGAHGSHTSVTVNLDRKTGRQLSLSELFVPTVNPAALLSKLCEPALKENLGEAFRFPEGVSPDPKNFRRWLLTPQGLVIGFEEYQVAAYVDGPRDVIIPYAVLKPYLRTDDVSSGERGYIYTNRK